MVKISFGNPIEPMGPYYSEADLNDLPVSQTSVALLESLINEAGGSLACELKEDGFRCQVHVDGQDVQLFTRGSGEFEGRCFPEIVQGLKELGLEVVTEEVKTEFDRERRDGEEPQPLDEEPGALLEELVEEDPSLVEGDGQAEGGEGEMQRLPLLGNHQSRGHCNADRHQHEDFHCSLTFLQDSPCPKTNSVFANNYKYDIL